MATCGYCGGASAAAVQATASTPPVGSAVAGTAVPDATRRATRTPEITVERRRTRAPML
ncbi:hypothetical protein [Rhodococcus sp. BP-334]